MEVSHTDIALVKLLDTETFSNVSFQNTMMPQPIQLKKFVSAKTYGHFSPIFLNSPNTNLINDTFMLTSFQTIPNDDNSIEQQWIFTVWVYSGQDSAINLPEGMCGSAIWDEDGDVLGFFKYAPKEGVMKDWCAGIAADELIKREFDLTCIAAGYIVSVGGVFLQFFATTPAHFFGDKILTGLPLGCFTTVAPTYASEMAPLAIRGSITAGMNFAIVLGQLIGYGVMRQASFYTGSAQYKVLFATQWGFAALVAHGRDEKARTNLTKLHAPEYDIDGHMAEIRESLARINQDNTSQGTMLECFGRDHWKRTMVATSVFFIQNACGSAWVVGYMSYFMQLGGMSAENAFSATVGLSGVMVVGNMCGWFFVERFGRRGTALWGIVILCVTLFLIGILACISTAGAINGQVAFMAVWSFVYQGTIGSAAWPIAAEAPTSRLRSPTQSLATIMNGLSSCIWSFALPAVLVFAVAFIYFFIPETKGRTYMEIDELWAKKIAPRGFKDAQLLPVGDDHLQKTAE
ncbi:hypothetical protein GQ53DRAFT_849711 [Thozetella sp. PMI_491]|nr:hypothetical protein GQ53DRAFT_849711 [Thozetella sp. PMI_491]